MAYGGKISIFRDEFSMPFSEEQYVIELSRQFGGYEEGDLICSCTPFFGVPLILEIAIRKNGDIVFREWRWTTTTMENPYLHTSEISSRLCEDPQNSFRKPFIPTEQQIDTVNGLFSGRIKFEGLKLAVGATLQNICPIDVEREEKLLGTKIYLA